MQHFLPHIFSETEADPQTKIFGHHWGGRPHPMAGLNRRNTPLNSVGTLTSLAVDLFALPTLTV